MRKVVVGVADSIGFGQGPWSNWWDASANDNIISETEYVAANATLNLHYMSIALLVWSRCISNRIVVVANCTALLLSTAPKRGVTDGGTI